MRTRSFRARLLAIAVLALALRAVFVVSTHDDFELKGDAAYYHEAANLLADGQGLIDPFRRARAGETIDIVTAAGEKTSITLPDPYDVPTAGHPPVYIVYLAAFSMVGLDSVLAHRLASALLGTLSVVLAGLAGRELRRGRSGADRLGLVAAVVTALYAAVWINDGILLSEPSAIAAAFGATLVGLRFAHDPSLRNAAWFGAAGGLAALTRAELVLYLPVVALVVLLRTSMPWRDRVLRYACAGVVALACIGPWVMRNLTSFADPVLLSNGAGTVLVQSNCDPTYYGPEIGYWSLDCGEPQPYGPDGEILDESERDAVVRARAIDYISSHRTRLLTVVVPRRIGRMWGFYRPWHQIDLDVLFEGKPLGVARLAFIQYALLAPLALAGTVLSRRRHLPLLATGLWALLATFTAASTFGNTRYRTAAEVSVVLLSSVAIVALAERFSGREGDTAAAVS